MSKCGRMFPHLVAWLLLALTAGGAWADVRVALIASGDDLPSMALAEVMLSEQSDVALIERTAIRRLLEEQALQISGLRDPAEAIRIGRLAGADLFAFLETTGNPPHPMALVVFDAASGARFHDAPLSTDTPEQTALAVSDIVQQAVRDYRAPAVEQVTLGLLTVRNANLPTGLDERCQAVGRLVLQRLGRHANVQVLERRWLERVNLERDLPTDRDEAELTGSMHTVELELSRAGDGSLRARGWLTAPGDEQPREVEATAAAEDFEGLTQSLAQQLADVLDRTKPGAPFDHEAEAARFADEANFWADHRQSDRRLEALEAASALVPGDIPIRMQLIAARLDHASNLMSPGWERVSVSGPQSLPRLIRRYGVPTPASFERAGDLALRGLEAAEGIEHRLPLETRQANHRLMRRFVLWRHDPPTGFPERDYRAYRARYRQMQDEAFEQQVKRVATVGRHFAFIESRHRALIFDTADAFTTDWLERAERALAARPWPADDPAAVWQAEHLINDSILWAHGDPLGRWRLEPEHWHRIKPTMHRLSQQPHPLMAAYGRLGLLLADARRGEVGADLRSARFHALALEAVAALDLAVAEAPLDARSRTRDQYEQRVYRFLPRVAGWLELSDADERIIARGMLTESADQGRLPAGLVHWWLTQTGEGSSDPAFVARLLAVAERHELDSTERLQAIQTRLHRAADAQATASEWQMTQLVDPARVPECDYVHHLFVHEERVYTVGLTGGGQTIVTLLSAPLAGGEVQVHNQFTADRPAGTTGRNWGYFDPALRTAVFDGSRLYLGTEQHGVLVLPVDGAEPWTIGVEHGLPSAHVQAMALMDGRLYLGLGDGGKSAFLVCYHLADGWVDLLASTQRQEPRSALDAATPFVIRDILADPARARALFVIDELDPHSHEAIGVSGIWAWRAEADRPERVMRFHRRDARFTQHGQTDNRVLVSQWETLSWFDLEHDSIDTIVGWPPHEPSAEPLHPSWAEAVSGEPPYMLWGDQIWSGRMRGDVRSGHVETLPVRAGRRAPPGDVQLLAADDQRVLYATSQGIWLVEPPNMQR